MFNQKSYINVWSAIRFCSCYKRTPFLIQVRTLSFNVWPSWAEGHDHVLRNSYRLSANWKIASNAQKTNVFTRKMKSNVQKPSILIRKMSFNAQRPCVFTGK